jgi:hypothetical protein
MSNVGWSKVADDRQGSGRSSNGFNGLPYRENIDTSSPLGKAMFAIVRGGHCRTGAEYHRGANPGRD